MVVVVFVFVVVVLVIIVVIVVIVMVDQSALSVCFQTSTDHTIRFYNKYKNMRQLNIPLMHSKLFLFFG